FENHIFFEEWGKLDPERFAQHFRFDLEHPWHDHQWRPSPDQEWRSFHGDQNAEWEVLALARTHMDERAALRSTSMGAPQIMGFNHQLIGYETVQEMFSAFTSSAHAQIIAFYDFVGADPSRLEALRRGDYLAFAASYNGDGQAPLYAALIQDALQVFARLRAPAPEGAMRPGASQLPAPGPTPPAGEVDPELYAAWRRHILDGFEHNQEMFERLVEAFMGPYHATVWMYRVLFAVGLSAFVVAAVLSAWTGQAWFGVIFGGLGLASFISYFLSRPLRALEENLNFITWLGIIYNSYWTRLVYAMNQETIQQDLDDITEDFVRQIERLLDKSAALNQNRPGLR
ncbi:MAG TPA: N-acetylmuramidase domain-containing protein, partial [Caldilineaceae bacterium]|nr:N-acetylmuramidase domain-containing protein [Caldilineaceae bacterium]